MSTYYASRGPKGGKPEWVEVQGTNVDIVPWFLTFCYTEEDQDNEGFDGAFDWYHIVESRSGFAICRELSKRQAMRRAAILLNPRSKRRYINRINALIREHGLSPRYKHLLEGDDTYAE